MSAGDVTLSKTGLLIDRETVQAIPRETPEGENVSESELRGVSAYTDFLNTLDMDDFGEGRQENE